MTDPYDGVGLCSRFFKWLRLWELRTLRFWRDVLCEFCIDFTLLFVGMSTIFPFEKHPPSELKIGIVGGLYVFVLIEAFGHVQWAVMNPVIGMTFAITGRISPIKAVLYLFADLAGAAAGTHLLVACAPPSVADKLHSLTPNPEMSNIQAVVVEMVLTGGVVLVTLGALDGKSRPIHMPGLPVGLSIALGIIAGIPLSGGVINPAVAFGPASVTGNWDRHWVYWAGDYLGAAIAIVMYHTFNYKEGPFIPSHHLEDKKHTVTKTETGEKVLDEVNIRSSLISLEEKRKLNGEMKVNVSEM